MDDINVVSENGDIIVGRNDHYFTINFYKEDSVIVGSKAYNEYAPISL